MALRDEIKRGREYFLESATRKEKFKYFIDYYGLRVALIAIALIALITFIIQTVTKPEPVLNGTFFNVAIYDTDDVLDELKKDFEKAKELDTSKYSVSFNTNLTFSKDNENNYQDYTLWEGLYAQMSAKVIDFIVGTSDQLLTLAYNEAFVDLSTMLTEEQMEQYKPYFLYIDQALVTLRREDDSIDQEAFKIPFPDCTKPEEMEEPIPVMIDMSQMKSMQELYENNTEGLCYGIVANGENRKNAVEFLELITK